MAMHPRAAGGAAGKSADIDAIESGDAGIGISLVRIGKTLWRPELARWRPIVTAMNIKID